MSNDQTMRAAIGTQRPEVTAQDGAVDLDRFDQDPRPLGPMALRMHLRRQAPSKTQRQRPEGCDSTAPLRLESGDGVVAITLQLTANGLLVERVQHRPAGSQLTQAMLFRDVVAFAAWCAADPARFEHPMLHERLRREGDEALRPER